MFIADTTGPIRGSLTLTNSSYMTGPVGGNDHIVTTGPTIRCHIYNQC